MGAEHFLRTAQKTAATAAARRLSAMSTCCNEISNPRYIMLSDAYLPLFFFPLFSFLYLFFIYLCLYYYD
jgi:hypothetical protein